VLRGTPLTPPGSSGPKASQSPLRCLERPIVTNPINGPKTLNQERHSRSKDPSPRLQLQTRRSFAAPHLRIQGSFAVVADPGPKTRLCAANQNPKIPIHGCNSGPEGPSLLHTSGSEDPSLWLQVRARRPFAAPPIRARRSISVVATPSPKARCCATSGDPKNL